MNKEEFLHDLEEALQTTESLTMETNLLDLEEWDSLGIVSTIAMFDSKYGKKMDINKLTSAKDIKELFLLVC